MRGLRDTMNIFNKIFAIVTLIIGFVTGLIAILFPQTALAAINGLAAGFHTSFFPGTDGLARVAARAPLAITFALVIGGLLYLELRPPRSSTIEVSKATGGKVRVTTASVEKKILDDPAYETKKAQQAIARFVSLHEHNLAQKAEIIVEHFRQHVAHKIGGQAKAMVVTSSRLHAVRYKHALDAYIRGKGYGNVHALVAFSGTVDDKGLDFTEPNICLLYTSPSPRD